MKRIKNTIVTLIIILFEINSFGQVHRSNYKILKETYNPKTDLKITKVKYYNPYLGRFVIVNIISSPKLELSQREIESKSVSLLKKSDENNKANEKINKNDTLQKIEVEVKQPQKEIVSNKDTIVYSSKQFVYEYDENRNLKRIENSGLKLVGNVIKNESDEELFIRKDIDKNSQEYLELSQLNLKKGIYILEKNLNKENELVYFRIVSVKFANPE